MKNLTRFLLSILVVTGLAFTGCEESQSLLDVTIEADYESDLDIVVSPSTLKAGINGVFSSSTTIDPLSNAQVAEYANNIKSVEIIEARGTITSVSKDAMMLVADMDISSNDLPHAAWLYNDVPIEVGSVIELTNENGQLDKLSDILNAKEVFTINLSGQTDEDDLTFTMSVFLKARITANPL